VVDQRYFVYTARTPSGGVCVIKDELHLLLLFFPYLVLSLLSGIINASTDMEIMYMLR
jgi:hypothetical protein